MTSMSTPVARVLPSEEWAEKLADTPMAGVPLDPAHSLVVVVEQDNRVVAQWAAMTTVHVEGLWEAEAVRGTIGVSRALLGAMVQALRDHGVGEVLTQSLTPEIDTLITKAGGHKVPGATWVIPITAG